ncbi:GCN5-related N-acetyltransferase [uncultured Microbacterium sp.]|uniref:GCN5-related N-acetyltransferase n=1 Tax=uncultured Microbacterium sp. TaxID=191216 RepID=A0A1Y5P466_9MICO|nr:GCN5-related N-acetyltransferase [uncultured Microbacterium sp.]
MVSTDDATLAERLGPTPEPITPEHPDVTQWRPASLAEIDAMHSVFAAAAPVDHPTYTTPREELEETLELSHVDAARDTLVGFAADGTPVAVGVAMPHADRSSVVRTYLDGVVHPDWRRRGIGGAVVQWELARALQQFAESGAALPAEAVMYADERDAGAVVLAERLGLQTERWFTSMVRDSAATLPELPEVDGIQIVPFTPELAEAGRTARNDAFRDHWGSLPTDPERWEQFVGGPFFRYDLSRVALAGDRIVAFSLASVNEDDWETLGASNAYIDLIGVVRDHRRRGLAPLVVSRTLAAIADAGLEKAVLDVDTESPTGANTLYERLGFTATDRSRALVKHY